jgi:preprotein translocase subunit SecA
MGRAIYEAVLDSERAAGERTGAAKVGRSAVARRNDPCPCGSGRKFKKCCGRQVH